VDKGSKPVLNRPIWIDALKDFNQTKKIGLYPKKGTKADTKVMKMVRPEILINLNQ